MHIHTKATKSNATTHTIINTYNTYEQNTRQITNANIVLFFFDLRVFFLAFFLSWVLNTQLNHWTKAEHEPSMFACPYLF